MIRDLEVGHLYGLEKFWAFLKYSGRKIVVHQKIRALLEKYQTLDDFRTNVSSSLTLHRLTDRIFKFIPPQGFHSYKIEFPEQSAVESGIESE